MKSSRSIDAVTDKSYSPFNSHRSDIIQKSIEITDVMAYILPFLDFTSCININAVNAACYGCISVATLYKS